METRIARQKYGLTRAVINNMVIGVSEKFERRLQMIGVGYKAEIKDNKLDLKLGFSHSIRLNIPEGIEISVAKSTKGNVLILSGIDNEKITSFIIVPSHNFSFFK